MKRRANLAVMAAAWVLVGCATDRGTTGSSSGPPPQAKAVAPPPEPPPTETPRPASEPGPRLMGQNERPAASTEPEAAKLDKIEPPAKPAEWRPAWWIDAPLQQGGRVRVAASAEADGVLAVRRAAMAAGREALRLAAGSQGAPAETLRYTAIRLPDGRYRGFVLMGSGK